MAGTRHLDSCNSDTWTPTTREPSLPTPHSIPSRLEDERERVWRRTHALCAGLWFHGIRGKPVFLRRAECQVPWLLELDRKPAFKIPRFNMSCFISGRLNKGGLQFLYCCGTYLGCDDPSQRPYRQPIQHRYFVCERKCRD